MGKRWYMNSKKELKLAVGFTGRMIAGSALVYAGLSKIGQAAGFASVLTPITRFADHERWLAATRHD